MKTILGFNVNFERNQGRYVANRFIAGKKHNVYIGPQYDERKAAIRIAEYCIDKGVDIEQELHKRYCKCPNLENRLADIESRLNGLEDDEL